MTWPRFSISISAQRENDMDAKIPITIELTPEQVEPFMVHFASYFARPRKVDDKTVERKERDREEIEARKIEDRERQERQVEGCLICRQKREKKEKRAANRDEVHKAWENVYRKEREERYRQEEEEREEREKEMEEREREIAAIHEEVQRSREKREEREKERKKEEDVDIDVKMEEFEKLERITMMVGFSKLPYMEIIKVFEGMSRYVDNPPQPARIRRAYLQSIQKMISMYWNCSISDFDSDFSESD